MHQRKEEHNNGKILYAVVMQMTGFAPVSMYSWEKSFGRSGKAGMKALAGDAKILYLLPENETVEGLEGEVKYAIKKPDTR